MASPRHIYPTEICGGDEHPKIAHSHDRQLQEIVSAGIKANRKLKFHIELEGELYYELLQILDQRGLDTDCIMTMRQCVHMADRIMEQLRAQRFYGPPTDADER